MLVNHFFIVKIILFLVLGNLGSDVCQWNWISWAPISEMIEYEMVNVQCIGWILSNYMSVDIYAFYLKKYAFTFLNIILFQTAISECHE